MVAEVRNIVYLKFYSGIFYSCMSYPFTLSASAIKSLIAFPIALNVAVTPLNAESGVKNGVEGAFGAGTISNVEPFFTQININL